MDTLKNNVEKFEYDENNALEILKVPHPLLETELEPFDFNSPPISPITIAKHLADTLIKNDGVGLSCNQIGMPYRACILATTPFICMFNPVIVATSDDTNVEEEGCLSIPNLLVKIRRYDVVRVRYAEPSGKVMTRQFEMFTARAIQHEIDHLDGILMTRRANKIHFEQAKRKARKLSKEKV